MHSVSVGAVGTMVGGLTKRAAAALLPALAAVACTGGSGGPGEALDAWESASISTERASNDRERAALFEERTRPSNERAPVSTEPPPDGDRGRQGAPNAGDFVAECLGTYECNEVGDDDRDTFEATLVNGVCTIAGFGVEADGRLTRDGQQVGSWVALGSGIVVRVGNDTSICVRR